MGTVVLELKLPPEERGKKQDCLLCYWKACLTWLLIPESLFTWYFFRFGIALLPGALLPPPPERQLIVPLCLPRTGAPVCSGFNLLLREGKWGRDGREGRLQEVKRTGCSKLSPRGLHLAREETQLLMRHDCLCPENKALMPCSPFTPLLHSLL